MLLQAAMRLQDSLHGPAPCILIFSCLNPTRKGNTSSKTGSRNRAPLEDQQKKTAPLDVGVDQAS